MKFNWVAEDYFQNSKFQYDHAMQALSDYLFTGFESVLDVGCGDGKITVEIAKKATNGCVIGVDSSCQMIKFAKSEFQDNYANLSFEVCRAQEIYFNNQFDLITSFACLHWVKDQHRFLSAAKTALKPNGKIILNLYPKHPDIWGAIEETTLTEKWNEYFSEYENPHICYDLDIYRKLCNDAGLEVISLTETTPVAYFSTKQDMAYFLKSWLPHTDQVHPHLRDDFIDSIISTFIKKREALQKEQLGMPFKRIDAILQKTS